MNEPAEEVGDDSDVGDDDEDEDAGSGRCASKVAVEVPQVITQEVLTQVAAASQEQRPTTGPVVACNVAPP
jgi:hypothetical protein